MNTMNRRRALMQGESPYEKLKYLRSSGTQWMNSGIPSNTENMHAVIKCRVSFGVPLGFWVNGANSIYFTYISGDTASIIIGGLWRKDDIIFSSSDTHIMEMNKIGDTFSFKVDDATYTSPGTYQVGDTSLNYGLFCVLRQSDQLHKVQGEIYEVTLNDIHLVPRLRKSDNKPGMLDLVTNTFFVNQGTGEFGYEKLDGTIVNPI